VLLRSYRGHQRQLRRAIQRGRRDYASLLGRRRARVLRLPPGARSDWPLLRERSLPIWGHLFAHDEPRRGLGQHDVPAHAANDGIALRWASQLLVPGDLRTSDDDVRSQ
jgi:peptidoglycan/xylan/chitin deacetylase (PgdA/CDA1 family)